MLDLSRDPNGVLARLACDRCGRTSAHMLGGAVIDAMGAPVVRDWLRMHCGGAGGWSLLASEQDGQAVTLDLCPRCTRKTREECPWAPTP